MTTTIKKPKEKLDLMSYFTINNSNLSSASYVKELLSSKRNKISASSMGIFLELLMHLIRSGTLIKSPEIDELLILLRDRLFVINKSDITKTQILDTKNISQIQTIKENISTDSIIIFLVLLNILLTIFMYILIAIN